MTPFNNLSQEALLIALTEYYQKYRTIIEYGGDQDEFETSKITLEAILNELNSRRGQVNSLFASSERTDFDFRRIDTKAD